MSTFQNTSELPKSAVQSQSQSNSKVRVIAVTGMLSAVAFILQFFEFPIPLIPSFIKMDFSDLPALIGAFALGPVCGVLIELIKNLLHLTVSQSGGVGEMANFLIAVGFVLPAGWIYKVNKTKKGAIIASLVGAACMAILSFPVNLFITYPFYEAFMPREAIIAAYQAILPSVKTLPQCLLVFNVPFTFVKAMISVVVTLIVYKKISPILHGK